MAALGRIAQVGPRWLGFLAVVCVAVGALAGINPTYGLLAALGLMFVVVTIMDLTLGVCMFTAVSFLDLASSSGSFTGTKVVGLVVFVSWLARIVTRRGAELEEFVRRNPRLVMAMLLMLGWAVLSVTWAFSRGTALTKDTSYALDMLLVPILYSAVRTRQHAIWVATAYVAGAVFSGAYGMVHPTTSGLDAGRLTGTTDSNYEAAVLAAAIPLVVALFAHARGSLRLRALALVAVAILFASLVQTLSREGLLAFGAVLVGAVAFGGRWRWRAATLLVVGVVATAGYYLVLAPSSSLQRVTMSSTSGRSSIWTVATRVFEHHPLLGVGTGNFILVSRQYVNQPGAVSALYLVRSPVVTHNTYLEALADLGIPGLLTLLAVFGWALSAAARAARIFARNGDQQMELLSRGVVLALAGILVADFFVSNSQAKYLWLLIAMCPVLLRLAEDGTDAPGESPAPSVRRRRPAQPPSPLPPRFVVQ